MVPRPAGVRAAYRQGQVRTNPEPPHTASLGPWSCFPHSLPCTHFWSVLAYRAPKRETLARIKQGPLAATSGFPP